MGVRRFFLVELKQLTLDYRPCGSLAINARITMDARSTNRLQLPGDKIFDDRVSLHFAAPPSRGASKMCTIKNIRLPDGFAETVNGGWSENLQLGKNSPALSVGLFQLFTECLPINAQDLSSL
jgi:hypothetical protein